MNGPKNKDRFPSERKSEGEPLKEIEALFYENSELFESDRVLASIKEIATGALNKLPKKDGVLLVNAIAELIFALKDYHNSYTTLKGISKFRLSDSASKESIKRYQANVQDADLRERALHNKFVDSLNILSRTMKNLGLDNSWRSDDAIYAPDEEGRRERAKQWMLKIFGGGV